ncbi:MAG: hypothetical protein VX842_04535, partial [Actinomycetota bacterium]|nr:hypothetical protein [Actinomycetota bacterium]
AGWGRGGPSAVAGHRVRLSVHPAGEPLAISIHSPAEAGPSSRRAARGAAVDRAKYVSPKEAALV